MSVDQIFTLAGLVLGTVFHEVGHLLCGSAVGIPIRLFSIGIGPVLFRWRVHETHFEIRLIPISGFVKNYSIGSATRFGVFVFLFGGVMGNFVLGSILIALFYSSFFQNFHYALHPMITVQEFLFVGNLVPFTFQREGRKISSDGKWIFELFRGKRLKAWSIYRDTYAEITKSYGSKKTSSSIKAVSTSRVLYQLGIFLAAGNQAARQEPFEALRRELSRAGLMPVDELVILETFLTLALIDRDETLLPFRDEWSARAVALAPDVLTVRATRGAVLVDIGREGEGKTLLQPLLEQFAAASFDGVMVRLFLAKAFYALGELADSMRLLDEARTVTKQISESRLDKILSRIEVDLGAAKLSHYS